MESIGDHPLQASLAETLERVGRGEHFAITEDGQPVAALAPPIRGSPVRPGMGINAAIENMSMFRKERGPTIGDGPTIRQMIEGGRRSRLGHAKMSREDELIFDDGVAMRSSVRLRLADRQP